MRRWSWLMLVCFVNPCPCQPTVQNPGGGSTASQGGQCAQHEFPQTSTAEAAITCPRKVCGLNGSWLGAGVPFRTLHLHGGANPEGIALLGVADRNSHALTIDLAGDVLTAWPTANPRPTVPCLAGAADAGTDRPGVCLTGAALTGVSLFLGPAGGKPTYQLTIDSVTLQDFWAQCDRCSGPVTQAPHYHFTARSLEDGCAIALCDPSLAQRSHTGIAGTLVMFRGDFYDDATYQVSDATTPDRANADGDLFNLACQDTALYKLYMLRHTNASASPGAAATPPQRTAVLRLFTADYCGIGHSFTENGIPIEIGFNPASSPYQVTAASGYVMADGDEVDARWTDAGAPAACLGTPRLTHHSPLYIEHPDQLMTLIHDTCPRTDPAIVVPPDCTAKPPSFYVTSANPR